MARFPVAVFQAKDRVDIYWAVCSTRGSGAHLEYNDSRNTAQALYELSGLEEGGMGEWISGCCCLLLVKLDLNLLLNLTYPMFLTLSLPFLKEGSFFE